jgi:hypothetical protein
MMSKAGTSNLDILQYAVDQGNATAGGIYLIRQDQTNGSIVLF